MELDQRSRWIVISQNLQLTPPGVQHLCAHRLITWTQRITQHWCFPESHPNTPDPSTKLSPAFGRPISFRYYPAHTTRLPQLKRKGTTTTEWTHHTLHVGDRVRAIALALLLKFVSTLMEPSTPTPPYVPTPTGSTKKSFILRLKTWKGDWTLNWTLPIYSVVWTYRRWLISWTNRIGPYRSDSLNVYTNRAS